jgi:hypothetical protein
VAYPLLSHWCDIVPSRCSVRALACCATTARIPAW